MAALGTLAAGIRMNRNPLNAVRGFAELPPRRGRSVAARAPPRACAGVDEADAIISMLSFGGERLRLSSSTRAS
jgi:hypothetical protein